MAKKHDVFISYAWPDQSAAKMLASELTKNGVSVFIDSKRLKAGDAWSSELEKSLASSKAVIMLVSPASLSSQWSNYEMGLALGRTTDSDFRLIPVLMRDIDAESLPAPIRSRQRLRFSGTKRDVGRLVEHVVDSVRGK